MYFRGRWIICANGETTSHSTGHSVCSLGGEVKVPWIKTYNHMVHVQDMAGTTEHFEFENHGIVDAPAEATWEAIGDFSFGNIKEVHLDAFDGPGRRVGATRTISPPGFGDFKLFEELLMFNEPEKTFAFSVTNPGFTKFVYEWAVIPINVGEGAGSKCIMRFRGKADIDFSAIPEAAREGARALSDGTATQGFRAIIEINAKRIAAGE